MTSFYDAISNRIVFANNLDNIVFLETKITNNWVGPQQIRQFGSKVFFDLFGLLPVKFSVWTIVHMFR